MRPLDGTIQAGWKGARHSQFVSRGRPKAGEIASLTPANAACNVPIKESALGVESRGKKGALVANGPRERATNQGVSAEACVPGIRSYLLNCTNMAAQSWGFRRARKDERSEP